jgi:prevent-host-death family protein
VPEVVRVSELEKRASEIIRAVREQRARYVITHRGRPIGVLMPLEETGAGNLAINREPAMAAWDELVRLGEEIGRGRRSSLTSAELLSQMRRQESG